MADQKILAPVFTSIPEALRTLKRWVIWKDSKVPFLATAINSKASVTDPNTWASFDSAQAAYEEGGYLGVGIVLNGDGLVGVDIDHCVKDRKPSAQAMALLEQIGCQYIELSPSGNGLRSFGYGANIEGVRGDADSLKVELYSNKRYLTVTGHVIRFGEISVLPGFGGLADSIRNGRLQKRTEEHIGNFYSPPSSSVEFPQNTLPKSVGQRNQCLFALARYCRGCYPDATKQELRLYVLKWHETVKDVILTKDFAISWSDFLTAWKSVQIPFGLVLDRIVRDMDDESPLPAEIDALGYGTVGRKLVRVCAALQAHHASEPFFLSARVAGDILQIHFTEAAKVLKSLVADQVLSLIIQGSGKSASRYRYVGGGCSPILK